MLTSVSKISCQVLISLWILNCAARHGNAQTRIDDVHVAPRQTLTAVAKPESGVFAPYGAAALIKTTVHLVLVPVTITDTLNRAVVGLGQANFQLFDGKKAQEIKNFSSEHTPVSLGIILDVSGSMGDKMNRAREAIRQFCDA